VTTRTSPISKLNGSDHLFLILLSKDSTIQFTQGFTQRCTVRPGDNPKKCTVREGHKLKGFQQLRLGRREQNEEVRGREKKGMEGKKRKNKNSEEI
jgi:hypothetical protein